MALDDTGYDLTAQLPGLNQQDDPQPFSNYWLHMDGKSLETAVVDRARRFRESQSADGLRQRSRQPLGLACHHGYDPCVVWGERDAMPGMRINSRQGTTRAHSAGLPSVSLPVC
jgi:hypothetical protein